MAANKFATMLHRNTNKIVVILVYAVLEWVLILLLLLNSLFSYLISRFAKWVGLQPPCLWCSRVDHILQQGNDKKKISNLDKDLLCEAHASEISKLGYCSNHRKLSEANTMCEDCLASRPNHYHEENSIGMRHRIAFISWVSNEQQHVENVENSDNTIEKCSCCNENLRSQFYPPYLLLKPSWGDDGNYTSKGSLIVESIDDDDNDEKEGDKELEFERNNDDDDDDDEHQILSDIESFILREVAEDRSSSVSNLHSDEKDAEKDEIHEKEEDLIITEVDPSGSDNFIGGFEDNSTKKASLWEDRSLEFIDMHFESNAARDSNRLIPVMFIDSITSMQFQSWKIDEDLREKQQEIETSVIKAQSSILEGEALPKIDKNEEKTSIGEFEDYDTSMPSLENSIVMEFEELQKDSAAAKPHPERITIEDDQILINDDDKNVEASLEEQDKTHADLPLLSRERICSYESMKEDESSTDEESSTSDDDAEVHNAFEAFIAQNNLNKSQSQCNDDESLKSEDDDDIEVQNAFEEFIAQNNLSKSQSLCNGDNNIEADMEEPKPDNTHIDNLLASEEPACSCQCIEEDQSSESEDDTDAANAFDKFIAQNNLCPDKTDANDNDDAEMIDKTNSVEKNNEEISRQSSKCSESYEAEEEKLPETPTSSDGMHYLQRKLMLFDKRESGAEDSVDGSVASELEYGDPSSTIEKLKTALKSERKALTAIYQELEEERSASAVAANQTMAMITRLQEEKAAMQMEALQYQRMMEEQAEYDQEALQLLNELMVKREKEKEELEKELEEYRQKVMDYEAKEKLRVLRRMKGSCSDTRSSDDLSIDLNRGVTRDEENGFLNNEEININNNNNNINASNSDTVSNLEDMAMDCVKHISALDDSLADFEEERASILDQLRELEEKIMSLEDSEEFIDDIGIKLDENSSEYADKNYSSPEDNIMHSNNGFSDDNNTKHATRRTTFGSLAKRLLPYLDAAENDTEEEAIACTFDTTTTMELEPESVTTALIKEGDDSSMMKVSIEEEVDRVYERLQALETDREFLQHCVGSIQNGDKGMDLLQEILQHLRDLKSVELRLKNLGSDQVE